MNIIKFPDAEKVNNAVAEDRPLIAAIESGGATAVVCPAEELPDHRILLESCGFFGEYAESFFRIRFNSNSADWEFDCPPHYNDIPDLSARLSGYYSDGLRIIPEFLVMFGYFSKLKIKNAPPEIWEF
ncbi:MAG: hypothetical protein E7495_08470 [Ruminococcus flavefaciens]|jgi:hypothetical protein|nr:hypothetical protein [Ruminococcus flavefaciens]